MNEVPPQKKPEGENIVALCISVCLLSMLAMLVANSYILFAAANLNDRACRGAAVAAARVSVFSRDTQEMIDVAVQNIRFTGTGGFIVGPPHLVGFKYEVGKDTRQVIVQTVINARVPVPMFLFDSALTPDKRIELTKTCIVKINNSQYPQPELH